MARRTWLVLALVVCACSKTGVSQESVKSAPTRSLAYPQASEPTPAPRPPEVIAPPKESAPAPIDTLHVDGIEALVGRAISRGQLPGCVVAIGTSQGLRYLHAFGERAVGEPMTLDTRFDLASVTKPIATASSVMALIEQGALSLDTPVWRHVPELLRPDKRGITVRHLLMHTSGLPKVSALSKFESGRPQAIANIAAERLESAPGTRFEYSDLGFILLGEMVERVSGARLDAYASTRLFAPLGMHETMFLPPLAEAMRAAPTEERDEQRIRGVVDDPRSYRLGGVAGHAGLFSTATDLARFAQMILRRGELDGTRVLAEDTISRFTELRSVQGVTRAPGWDARSPYAHGRGLTFSSTAFGHGGYTGTSLWIDPERDLFVILLSNRVYMGPRGTIHPLASSIADMATRALALESDTRLYTGIDVLEREAFARIRGRSVALLTHGAACDRQGLRTLDAVARAPQVTLKAIFTPEHGFDGKHEGHVRNAHFGAWPVYSLFGKTRKPTPEMLSGIDTVVIDLVDVGARFYTYMATVLATLEAAQENGIDVVLLDRPNPVDGVHVEGPISEPSFASFVNYHPLPLRHGMTAGELARFLAEQRKLEVKLDVVRVEHWTRAQWFGDTDLAWRAPSPNLATKEQAMLYPAVALVEGTNVSVGRGTELAFAVLGAPFIDGVELAQALNEAELLGVSIEPTQFRPLVGPYAGQRVSGVAFRLLDAHAFSAARMGLALISALTRLYPSQWDATRLPKLVAHQGTLDLIGHGTPLVDIEKSWSDELKVFESSRNRTLLY